MACMCKTIFINSFSPSFSPYTMGSPHYVIFVVLTAVLSSVLFYLSGNELQTV